MINADINIIEIGLLNKCNLKCPLCSRQIKKKYDKIKLKNTLDIKLLKQSLDYFSNLKHVKLVGAVCEPTLYPNLFELITYLKQRSISISISTNGSTHNSKWWIKLGKLLKEDDQVVFAIDGSTQDIHETYRVGSNLEKVISNHKSLKSNSNCKTVCQFIKFNFNIDDIFNVEKLSIQENFDKFKPINCGPSDKKILAPVKNYQIYSKILKSFPSKNFDDIKCEYKLKNSIYLNHFNRIVICEFQDENIFDQENKKFMDEFETEQQVIDYILEFKYNKKCLKECGKMKQFVDAKTLQHEHEE